MKSERFNRAATVAAMMSSAALVCGALACGAQVERSSDRGVQRAPGKALESETADVAVPEKPAVAGAKTPTKARPKKIDPLFPKRDPRGWKEMAANDKLAADAIADDYVEFITAGKTPRRAVTALVSTAEQAGARAAKPDERGLTGFHYVRERGGDAAVFFRSGSAPVSSGLDVFVVSVDAPRLVLKQRPLEERHALEMLQTDSHGSLDLRTWMVHPIALDVFVEKRGKPIAFSVGERTDEPVLSIPDLLPHLSRGSQKRGREVDSVERLDPLATSRSGGLATFLRSKKLTVGDLAQAEIYLVPAGPAVRVGVDRALIGGYGHGERALAFAAVRALGEANPVRAAAVVVVGRTADGGDGGSGYAYVGRAIRQAIGFLSERELDVYDTSLTISRSLAMVSHGASGKRNGGVIVDIGGADTLPAAARAVTTTLTRAKVPFVITDKSVSRASRDIAGLNLDVIGLAIPTKGRGAPGETVSVLDLYHGVLACRAWLSRSL